MTIDLKGWLAVADDGDDTVVNECVGTIYMPDKGLAVMLRNPATQECDLTTYVTAYGWFAPDHRAAAEAHAAKIISDYNAANAGDDDDETDEAA